MPTSPKTAKEIIGDCFVEFAAMLAHGYDFQEIRFNQEIAEKAIEKALRAAVEAVRPTNEEHKKSIDAPTDFHTESDVQKFMEGYTTCEGHFLIEFNANVARFFNDDPTSSPTPRN